LDFLTSALGFILAIGILVTVHEFGHFWVARRLGVKVLKFSIGFGRSLWSWHGKRDNTEYAIALIPLGGYVRMLDESEGEVPEAERHRAFNLKPLWVRSAVVVAGPAFNFLFAIAAYWLIFSLGVAGIQPVIGNVTESSAADRAGLRSGDVIMMIDGRPTQTWGEHRLYVMNQLLDGESLEIVVDRPGSGSVTTTLSVDGDASGALSPAGIEQALGMRPQLPELTATVGEVLEGSPAADAGLRNGDRIVAIDGREIASWRDLVENVMPRAGQTMSLRISRGEEVLDSTITPQAADVEGQTVGRIGVSPAAQPIPESYRAVARFSVPAALGRGVENTWLMSALTLKMLYRMLKLEISTENLSGPITIAHYAGQSVQIGVIPFLTFLAVISVSLGILNLLPVPVLDGGHLLYYAIELIRGGPVPERVMYWGQQLGILMLAALMLLAFYNDILRLLG
jgi:regulator of sigma E protease